jgi:hypothetical protein
MKNYENPLIRKQAAAAFFDPLGLRTKIKITLRRKTIAFLYPIGLVLGIGGTFLNHASQSNVLLVLLGTVLSMAGSLLLLISLVGALINSAKAGRWGWFLSLLFLSLFALVVYLFAGPESFPEENENIPS